MVLGPGCCQTQNDALFSFQISKIHIAHMKPQRFYKSKTLTLVHARQNGCAAINKILDGEATRDLVKGVLDAMVEEWRHHPPPHFRASLRAWRLAAAHKKSELRWVISGLETRQMLFL